MEQSYQSKQIGAVVIKVVFTFLVVMFGVFPISTADASTAQASAIIELGKPPYDSRITISFDRTVSETESLLMTSINLGLPKQMNQSKVTSIGDYFSHLTGWFMVRQHDQELWVGITLPAGKNHGELVINVSGILSEVDGHQNKYELLYYPSGSVLSDLKTASASVQYAALDSIKVHTPAWGYVLKDETTGWFRVQSKYYAPDLSGKKTNSLIIKQDSTPVADWMKASLSTCAGGMAVGMICALALFGMRGEIKNRHRQISTGVFVVCLVILLLMSGEFPPNAGVLLFEGAGVIGFAIPFLLVAILPTHISESIRILFKGIRGFEGGNHDK